MISWKRSRNQVFDKFLSKPVDFREIEDAVASCRTKTS